VVFEPLIPHHLKEIGLEERRRRREEEEEELKGVVLNW